MRDDKDLSEIRTIIARHKLWDLIFMIVGVLALMIAVLTFMALFAHMLIEGMPRLSWDFFTSFPSRRPGSAGILSAWVGTTLVMLVTAIAAVPMGIGAGIYLEEYASKNIITEIIEINVTNLAGVPSIIYGLLALSLFVHQFGFGQSILSAGLALALLILPVVIVATREAIRAITAGHSRGRLCAGRDQMADCLRSSASLFRCRYSDGRNYRPGSRDWGNRAHHHHWRADLYRFFATIAH